MPRQTPEQYAAFQELCRANQLDPRADVWQQKQSGQWIIGRTGIEKIQGHNNIAVTLDVVGFGIDYAGVKATATRTVKAEGAKTGKKLLVESLGSAHAKNCTQISYYLEMAEKRAKSRAILMLMGFYQLGIYGEDEAEAFQRPAEPAPAQGNDAGGSATASEPPVMHAVSNSAAPVASTGSDQSTSSIAGPTTIPAEILAKFTRQFEAATSGIEVKKLWESLTKNEATALFAVKEAAKARLAEAGRTAGTVVARQHAVPMKDAGTDTSLVAEFIEQPLSQDVNPPVLATTEQKQAITRLLDHPLVTRKEKTTLLLNINKLDSERARQALVKLRTTIEHREANTGERVRGLRELLASKLNAHGPLLGEEIVGEYQLLVENAEATAADLEAALAEVAQVLDSNQDHDEEPADETTQLAA